MITADRDAASQTRIALSKLEEEVTHNGNCMGINNEEIYGRFEAIEKVRIEETT
jgi:hypothetical protein